MKEADRPPNNISSLSEGKDISHIVQTSFPNLNEEQQRKAYEEMKRNLKSKNHHMKPPHIKL